jgi:hypothetical protein
MDLRNFGILPQQCTASQLRTPGLETFTCFLKTVFIVSVSLFAFPCSLLSVLKRYLQQVCGTCLSQNAYILESSSPTLWWEHFLSRPTHAQSCRPVSIRWTSTGSAFLTYRTIHNHHSTRHEAGPVVCKAHPFLTTKKPVK